MTDLMFEPIDVVSEDEFYHPEPWQLEAIDSILKTGESYSADWSEMGCYKTTTGLWLLQKRANEYREKYGWVPVSLIITSRAGKGTYFDAIPKSQLGDVRVYTVGVNKVHQVIGELRIPIKVTDVKREGDHVIFLAHYEVFMPRKNPETQKPSLSLIGKYLMQIEWTSILLDEAHKIKEKDTKWTRQIKRLRSLNKHIMTGTGFVNRPDEIWSLLHFLNNERWGSYWAFRGEYCDEYRNDQGYRVILGVKEEKLEDFRKLRMSLGPRFWMSEVHPNIKEPIVTERSVDLSDVQRKMFDEIKQELYTLDQKGEPITSPNVLSALNRLRQISVATPEVISEYYDEKQERRILEIKLVEPSSKLDEVMTLLDEIRWDQEMKRQVVIFSSFKDPLRLLETRFEKKEISYLHLETKHNEQQRYEMWHDTFPSKEHRVFMSTLQLGGESINLACANYLIFLDRSWSPKDMAQAVGRVYRPGQTGVPEIIYINARNSIDQRITNLLNIKGRWFNQVFAKDLDSNGD